MPGFSTTYIFIYKGGLDRGASYAQLHVTSINMWRNTRLLGTSFINTLLNEHNLGTLVQICQQKEHSNHTLVIALVRTDSVRVLQLRPDALSSKGAALKVVQN